MPGIIALFLTSGAAAIYAVETGHRVLAAVTKPLTTLLLLFILGVPDSPLGWLVAVGIVLSLAGDVALLSESNRAFIAGLACFLGAHLAYIAGFLTAAQWSPAILACALVVALAALSLLRAIWAKAAGLHVPVVLYASAISTMVITAFAQRGHLALGGAVLFFISDSSLALNRFHHPIKRVSFLTLGVYWLAQVGIALGARS